MTVRPECCLCEARDLELHQFTYNRQRRWVCDPCAQRVIRNREKRRLGRLTDQRWGVWRLRAPDGHKTFQKDQLVAKLRSFRGRYRMSDLFTILGISATRWNGLALKRLCDEYQIALADPEPDERPTVIARDLRVARAQDLLAEQIRQAREAMATARPYKPGPLVW